MKKNNDIDIKNRYTSVISHAGADVNNSFCDLTKHNS